MQFDTRSFPSGLAVAISPDNRYVATGFTSGIRLYDLETNDYVWEDTSQDHESRFVGFSPDGSILVHSSRVGNTKGFDTATGNELWTISGGPTNLAMSPTEDIFVTNSGEVRSVIDGSLLSTIPFGVSLVSFGFSGSLLATLDSADNSVIKIINVDSKEIIHEVDVGSSVADMMFSYNEKYVYYVLNNQRYYRVNIETGDTSSGSGTYDVYEKIVADSTDSYVLVYEEDDTSFLYNFREKSELKELPGEYFGPKVSRNNEYIITHNQVLTLYKEQVSLYISGFGNTPYLVPDGIIDIDKIRYAQNSNVMECKFKNHTSVPVENVQVSASAEPTGVDLTMSKTKDPFSAAQSLTFAGPYDAETGEDTFYIRVESTTSASEGPVSINLDLDATNYVG